MIKQEVQLTCQGQSISYSLNFDLDRDHDRHVWTHMRLGSGYEPEVCYAMLRILRPRDVAVDVGANFGYFSLLMARLVGSGGRVYAYEPAQEARDALFGNIPLNPGMDNIEVSAAAVSDKTGQAQFFYSLDDAAGSALWDPGIFPGNYKSAMNQRTVFCPCIKLDDLKLLSARLIKIDTEGAELSVLRGAISVLKTYKPFVVLEMNPFGLHQMGADTEQMRAFMSELGYSMFFLHQDGRLPTLIPPKTKVHYTNGVVIKNCMFATLDMLSQAWPAAGE